MTNRLTQQAAAFSFAAIVTLSMLGSINMLATQPVDAGALAAHAAAQVAAAKTTTAPM